MSSKRIILLVHEDLVPPTPLPKKLPNDSQYITEYDVLGALLEMNYDVKVVGIYDDLKVLEDAIKSFKPHLVFNLLEEFNGNTRFDQNVVSYLELLGVPYTGCNPRGLMLARNKDLAKKVLNYHEIPTPYFCTFKKGEAIKLPDHLPYPMIVKSLFEEASYGISQKSIVHSDEKLIQRIEYLHEKLETDVIVEQFIAGDEYTLGLMGNKRILTFPLWHLKFTESDSPHQEIYTVKAKWNEKYRKRKGIKSQKADVDPKLEGKIVKLCKKAYKALEINGLARFDLRVDQDLNPWIIEVNPNPNVARDDEFFKSAYYQGLEYADFIKKIVKLGL